MRLPESITGEERELAGQRITTAILDLVAQMGGSFSAEHGVGQAKRGLLQRYRKGPEYDLMRRLKKMLDPQNLLNPGKVI